MTEFINKIGPEGFEPGAPASLSYFTDGLAHSLLDEKFLKVDQLLQHFLQQTIDRLPGYDILSSNEKKLCSNLRMTPAHYISYKTCLLANHLQKKKGQTPKPLNPSGIILTPVLDFSCLGVSKVQLPTACPLNSNAYCYETIVWSS